MSIVEDVLDAAISLGKFLLGDKAKPDPKLEEPLGELKSEKRRRELEEARRAQRNHGSK